MAVSLYQLGEEDGAGQQLQEQQQDEPEPAVVTMTGREIADLCSDPKVKKTELANRLAKHAMQVSYSLHAVSYIHREQVY